jgi:hypothetical protein
VVLQAFNSVENACSTNMWSPILSSYQSSSTCTVLANCVRLRGLRTFTLDSFGVLPVHASMPAARGPLGAYKAGKGQVCCIQCPVQRSWLSPSLSRRLHSTL